MNIEYMFIRLRVASGELGRGRQLSAVKWETGREERREERRAVRSGAERRPHAAQCNATSLCCRFLPLSEFWCVRSVMYCLSFPTVANPGTEYRTSRWRGRVRENFTDGRLEAFAHFSNNFIFTVTTWICFDRKRNLVSRGNAEFCSRYPKWNAAYFRIDQNLYFFYAEASEELWSRIKCGNEYTRSSDSLKRHLRRRNFLVS